MYAHDYSIVLTVSPCCLIYHLPIRSSSISLTSLQSWFIISSFCSDSVSLFKTLFQVHLYWNLHFRVSNKDLSERFLFSSLHIPQRSVELAWLHRHRHGVSCDVVYTLPPCCCSMFVCDYATLMVATKTCGKL